MMSTALQVFINTENYKRYIRKYDVIKRLRLAAKWEYPSIAKYYKR